jgi:hypothetical protein
VVSILFMAALLTQISRSAVELLLFWTAIGVVLFAWSLSRAKRGIIGAAS